MGFKVIIPARYASTRLPGKVLLDIGGRPMLQWVFDLASRSGADEVIIATDHPQVRDVATGFGARVEMTSSAHRSGTDRLAEVVARLAEPEQRIIVNLQADEPLLPPELIRQAAQSLEQNPDASIATLCEAIDDSGQLFDANVVKVVRDGNNRALYFSRAPIPWHRQAFADGARALPGDTVYYRHIGLYAYRVSYLQYFSKSTHCEAERSESLEQLRALYAGHLVQVDVANQAPGTGVDTEDDLRRVRNALVQ